MKNLTVPLVEVKYLSHHQIDKCLWDDCIANSQKPLLYGHSWYLDITSLGWNALVYEHEQGYKAVLPLPVTTTMGFTKIKHPLYTQLLGLWIADSDFSEQKLWPFFVEKLLQNSLYSAGFQIFNESISSLIGFQKLIRSNRNCTHVLSLQKTYQEIYQGYSADRRLNLKRASKIDWKIEESQDMNPMIEIFRINTAHKIDGGVGEWAYSMLVDLFVELQKRQFAKLFYVSHNGRIEAAGLFTFYAGRIVYLFNTATHKGRLGNARTLLIDSVLKQYSGQDYLFDFESPMLEPIAHFYASFGAVQEDFLTLQWNHLPVFVQKILTLKKWMLSLYR